MDGLGNGGFVCACTCNCASIDALDCHQRSLPKLGSRVRAVGHAQPPAKIAGGGIEQERETLRPTDGVRAFEQAEHGIRAQLGGLVDYAMLTGKDDCEVATFHRRLQPFRYGARMFRTFGFMAVMVGQDVYRGVALAQIVQQAGPAHRERLGGGGSLVDDRLRQPAR